MAGWKAQFTGLVVLSWVVQQCWASRDGTRLRDERGCDWFLFMEIRNRDEQEPFTTKDGSTIRSLLDTRNAPVVNQSLAEAALPAGSFTDRHYHRLSEEFYYILEGRGLMEIDGEECEVGSGDAILIPAGAWHQIRAIEPLQFLCCCAPPYAHQDTYFE